MSKWDKKFDGSYESSRYANGTLEDDILRAMDGTIVGETSTGGLFRQTDSRLDVWAKGDSEGNYDHYYYNGADDYGKAPDGRHK